MSAILPARLKLQTARLAEFYTQPGIFVREMHILLKLYADQTHRPGQSGATSTLIESYNVPQPVMRQLCLAVKPIIENDTFKTLELCDTLWLEPYLEHRLLACTLLGQVPVTQPEPVFQRLVSWTNNVSHHRLKRAVIDQGMARLRSESPGIVLKLIEEWLHSTNIFVQQLGLQALIPQIEEPDFQNIPGVFRLLAPFLRNAPPPIRPDLIDLLNKLAMKAPIETAYTLHRTLEASDNPDTAWLTRQVLPIFPDGVKMNLRQALKIHRENT